jgi:MoaA/NifB/PqqE/SkfB family radical SAM enzyme
MAIKWQFYHWHLEPSAVCAVKCPRCPRVEHPDTPWLNKNMTLDFVKKFFTEDMLRNQVRRVTMCGDVGDPIYCKEYIEICRYIKTVNPDIHIFTITNGSYKKPEWWAELASVLNHRDTINFSVDGYDNSSNNLYRVNSNYDSIINGIKTVRQYNKEVFLNWALIVFSFNQDHLDNITKQATDLGMDGLQITKSTKFGSKYGGGYGGDNDPLEPRPEHISSTHRYERQTINLSNRVQNTVDYIQHNQQKYFEIAKEYADAPITPLCEIGNRGVYVNAEGVVFPCSWVSFPYTSLTYGDKVIHWKDSFFARYREQMNLHNRSFEEIIADPLWNKCSQGFTDPEKTWVECSQKCSTQYVDEKYAVGWETN